MALETGHFSDFFHALHGYEPFPWQKMLAERVVDRGWPEGIDLPTASGKTACIDVAVFALACSEPPDPRAPRRVFFVVDRRVIVDAAHDRAMKIADRLREAEAGVLREVADRLRHLAGTNEPLVVSRLRGGTLRDTTWRRSPVQPAIVTGTVDQIGSRLLFRGYGATNLTAPIDAALTACDSLVLLDEAHCAVPFLQTARSICRYAGPPWAESPVAPPLSFTILSATLPPEVEDVFPAERVRALDHEELQLRIRASKSATLQVAKSPAKRSWTLERRVSKDPLVHHAAQIAADHVGSGHRRIAVMVNRVATAHSIYRQLLQGLSPDEADIVLMTGRMRPLDRDELTERWSPFLRADQPTDPDRPIVLVTTQCLEVGADYSFEALITECASFDALRQRFGRLNRLGRNEAVGAVVLVRKEQTNKTYEDPIYGTAIRATWEWLRSTSGEEFDFGIAAVEQSLPVDPEKRGGLLAEMRAPAPDAPVMLPAHLDAWSQTSPRPDPEPEVGVFLHGPDRSVPEARVVWRADLGPDPDRWVDVVGLLPPLSAESLSVPLPALRRWLGGERVERAEVADVEGGDVERGVDPEIDSRSAADPQRFLIWRGRDRSEPTSEASRVKPDDVVIVPADGDRAATLGSLFQRPAGSALDIAEAAWWVGREKRILRVHSDVLRRLGEVEPVKVLIDALRGQDEPLKEELRVLLKSISSYEADGGLELPFWLKNNASVFADESFILLPHPSGEVGSFVLLSRARSARDDEDHADADDLTSVAAPQELDSHLEAVARIGWTFATECTAEDLSRAIELAGRLHDLGKADERFQVFLCGSELAAAAAPSPLAKSDGVPLTARQRSRLGRAVGLPLGFRHEMLSSTVTELAELIPADQDDRDLVLHLIESHHGHARPFAPVVPDDQAPGVRYTSSNGSVEIDVPPPRLREVAAPYELGSGVAERFLTLQTRFGWWGLAYLEAILRLADWTASQNAESSGAERKHV